MNIIAVHPAKTKKANQLPHWMQFTYEDTRQANDHELSELLRDLTVKDLRSIAKVRGWQLRGTRKDDILEQLIAKICDPDECRQAVKTLNPEQVFTLQALSMIGEFDGLDNADLEAVIRQLGLLEMSETVIQNLGHLREMGLVIRKRYSGGTPYTVPDSIQRGLSELLTIWPDKPTLADDDVEMRVGSPVHLLQSVRQMIIALTKSTTHLRPPMERPAKTDHAAAFDGWNYDPADFQKIDARVNRYDYVQLTVPPPAAALSDETIVQLLPFAGTEDRLDFLYALLLEAGIFKPGSPVTAWDEVNRAFLRLDLPDQHAVLARCYFTMREWNELWPILHADADYRLQRAWSGSSRGITPDNLRESLRSYRYLVLKALAGLPEDEWVEIAGIQALLQSYWDRFDSGFWNNYTRRHQHQHDRTGWQITYRDSALGDSKEPGLRVLQERFISTVLEQPLHWLGLADLRMRDGVLTHVRLHGLADLLFGRAEHLDLDQDERSADERDTGGPRFVVEGDQIRVDPVAVGMQGHAVLERCALLVETAPDAFIYQLDVATVHRFFEDRATLEALYADWETHLGAPAPSSIRQQLDRWWEAYGQVRLYKNVTVVEFGDDHALTEMRAVTSLDQLPYAEISQRLILIPQKAIDQLIDELERGGYTPRRLESG